MSKHLKRLKRSLLEKLDNSLYPCLYNEFFRGEDEGSYQLNKEKIEKLEVLSILDNQEDIEIRERIDLVKSTFWMVVPIPFEFLSLCFLIPYLSQMPISLEVLILIITFFATYTCYYWLCRFILDALPIFAGCLRKHIKGKNKIGKYLRNINLNRIRELSFLFCMATLLFIVSSFIDIPFKGVTLEGNAICGFVIVFIIANILVSLMFRTIIKLQSSSQLDIISAIPTYLLLLVPVVKIIYNTGNNWYLGSIFLTFSITVTKLITDFELKNRQKIAQIIFEYQLCSPAPDYQELKKCYYYGGEKYKEKMLSDRVFLKIILKNEGERNSENESSIVVNKKKIPPKRRVRKRKRNNYYFRSRKTVSNVSSHVSRFEKIKSFFSIFH